MKQILSKLKPVILLSPYENWKQAFVREMFSKMVTLKSSGYDCNYQVGTLPVGSSDFISTHILICVEKGSNLQPVMGYKTVTLKQCQRYSMTFDGLALVQNAQAPRHIEAVKRIQNDCEKNNRNLAYLGSWTVDPAFTKDHENKQILRELFPAVYSLFYNENETSDVVIGGTLRFKTEKIFSRLGHQALQYKGESLPSISIKHLQQEPVLVMYANHHSDYALEAAEKYEGWWSRNKLTIGSALAHRLHLVNKAS